MINSRSILVTLVVFVGIQSWCSSLSSSSVYSKLFDEDIIEDILIGKNDHDFNLIIKGKERVYQMNIEHDLYTSLLYFKDGYLQADFVRFNLDTSNQLSGLVKFNLSYSKLPEKQLEDELASSVFAEDGWYTKVGFGTVCDASEYETIVSRYDAISHIKIDYFYNPKNPENKPILFIKNPETTEVKISLVLEFLKNEAEQYRFFEKNFVDKNSAEYQSDDSNSIGKIIMRNGHRDVRKKRIFQFLHSRKEELKKLCASEHQQVINSKTFDLVCEVVNGEKDIEILLDHVLNEL